MKKTISLFLHSVLFLALLNCRGPEGPPGPQGQPGPQGPRGPQGPETIGLMFEDLFILNAENNFQDFFEFPDEAADLIFLEDVVLVYALSVVTINGEEIEEWTLLPLTFFEDEGVLHFYASSSAYYVGVFADASFPLVAGDEFSLFCRMVVVPAGSLTNGRLQRLNFENYHEVIEALGIPDKETDAVPFRGFKNPSL